jgi:poly(3-hydroxybutyrate) depolymerase
VPVLALHGTADRAVPIDGVTYGASVHPPVESWAAAWAARNGCEASPSRRQDAGNRSVILTWPGCPRSGEVTLYEVQGGGHQWFRGTPDASSLVWGFFQAETARIAGRGR